MTPVPFTTCVPAAGAGHLAIARFEHARQAGSAQRIIERNLDPADLLVVPAQDGVAGYGLGGNSALARDSADRTSLSCAMRSLAFCTTSAWVCI